MAILALSLTGWVTLDNSLSVSESHFLMWFLWEQLKHTHKVLSKIDIQSIV